MEPQQLLNLFNNCIILLFSAIAYCIIVIIVRLVKLVKRWERREKEFFNGAYFQLKLKEHNEKISNNMAVKDTTVN